MLVAIVVIERGRAGPAGLVLIAAAAVLAGSLAGSGRLDSIDSGAFHGPRGQVTLNGFVTGSPSESRGTARFEFETESGRLLVEAAPQEAGSLMRSQPGTFATPGWLTCLLFQVRTSSSCRYLRSPSFLFSAWAREPGLRG